MKYSLRVQRKMSEVIGGWGKQDLNSVLLLRSWLADHPLPQLLLIIRRVALLIYIYIYTYIIYIYDIYLYVFPFVVHIFRLSLCRRIVPFVISCALPLSVQLTVF